MESEESRRYIKSTPVVYVPPEFRSAAANVKQGSAGVHPKQDNIRAVYVQQTRMAVEAYEYMIQEGVCAEQARFVLPQGCEVNWVWTGSLYAFSNMVNQRTDSHAQMEIQLLAAEIDAIIAPLFPVSWAALTKGAY